MEEDLTASRVATSRLDAGACFDRPARWAAWLKCEAALAMAEAEIGIIPTLAGKMIAECCDASLLNADNIARAMEVQEHALTPVLDELGRVIREQVAKHQSAGGAAGEKPTMTPDEIAGYLHWGATTQNITQTGFVLNLRRAHSAILDSVAKYVAVIGRLCRDKAELVMPGRTHGQQALPVTFGYKCAAWLDELLRHAERLCQSADRLFRAILGGGAGTYASFGERGPQVASIYARRLGLKAMVVPFRNSVDHFSEYIMVLVMLGTTCGKMAREVRELGKDEFGELAEPAHEGGVGSSTMPQKSNPKLCMGIVVLETKLRSLPAVALESMMGDHEADGARTAMVGEACVEAIQCTSRILELCTYLFDGLRFFPARMMSNFQYSDGMITSERLMLELGRRGLGRDHAHHLVHQLCVTHGRRLRSFREEMRTHLTAPDLGKKKSKSFADLQRAKGTPTPPKSTSIDDLREVAGSGSEEETTSEEDEQPQAPATPERTAAGPPTLQTSLSTPDPVHGGLATPTRPRGRAVTPSPADAGVRASTDGLPRMSSARPLLQAKERRPRRLSLDNSPPDSAALRPEHPGSLASLAAQNADIIRVLGDGDKDVAEAAAETLLNPKNYTGECSKISLQGARRATRTVGALSDLSSRYNAISELVFHGRADEGNAGRITVLIEQLTDRAAAFQAISAGDELKEIPSFAQGVLSLPQHERMSSLNLAAAVDSAEERRSKLQGAAEPERPPEPTVAGPPVQFRQ